MKTGTRIYQFMQNLKDYEAQHDPLLRKRIDRQYKQLNTHFATMPKQRKRVEAWYRKACGME